MNATLRIITSIVIFLGIVYFAVTSFTRFGKDMEGKVLKDGIASQIKYHQGTIKDVPECAGYKARMDSGLNAKNMDEVASLLLKISGEARNQRCLK